MRNFVDAQAMHKLHPATFYAPTADELKQIKVGSTVKVSAKFKRADGVECSERFWVKVNHCAGNVIKGIVNNDLVFTAQHGMNDGTEIYFRPSNVLDIYPE